MPSGHPRSRRGLPWHWLLAALALLLGAWGTWTLWGPMRIPKPLPVNREFFPLKELAAATDLRALQHRQVFLRGRFTQQTVILEGRDMAGRAGYYVLAPFLETLGPQVPGAPTGLAILVQRGWVPNNTRLELNAATRPPRHEVLIEGRLAMPALGDASRAATERGLLRRNLDLPGYAREIRLPLLPMVVLELPGAEWPEEAIRNDAFQRRWPELYPQDQYIRMLRWALLAAALASAALAFAARPRRG